MIQEKRQDSRKNWVVAEQSFCPAHVRKYESIFCQGNGYMGIRAAVEEEYPRNVRYTLVAGTFDRMEKKNTTELPNSADTTAAVLAADGILLALTEGNHSDYERALNLKTGLLCRSFVWKPREGLRLAFSSERFVSLKNLHVTGQRISVKVLEGSAQITLQSGIRGGERYGEPHFHLLQSFVQEEVMQYAEATRESGIAFVSSACVKARKRGNGEDETAEAVCELKPEWKSMPEQAVACWNVDLNTGEELVMEKLCRIATSRDRDDTKEQKDADGKPDISVFLQKERESMHLLRKAGYEQTKQESAECWEKVWQQRDAIITGSDEDQLAFRFAVYHLTIMAPLHDHRMNIGAKGLSGKGYMGHTFWDTEIYMLPYFVWENPKGARSLLEYRYLCLDSARKKAAENGYEGAMYPWEAAWITDGEVCPEMHFARYEHHVTADVAFGIYYYYEVTHDFDFMKKYGCEMLFETAAFWKSRLEYCPEKDCYEIRDVIGPDEFTHHADNNAFTNYLAHLNLELALVWKKRLKQEAPQDYERLEQQLHLEEKEAGWRESVEKLVLPKPGERNILPQDDTYFDLPEIDLSVYRAGKRKLRQDYPYPEYTRLKVSKQADVMNLFLMREELFPEEVKRCSLAYYEPFCVHESSLSYCAYSMLAADCGEQEEAYRLFEKAREIDLGPDMESSNEGIHAASLGGIWQCCILGFGGIRLCNGELRIRPNLPKKWESIRFKIRWRESLMEITASKEEVTVQVLEGPAMPAIQTGREILTGYCNESERSRA